MCCRSRSERQGGQGDVVYPIGYSEKPVPDTSIQETDKNLVEKVSNWQQVMVAMANLNHFSCQLDMIECGLAFSDFVE